MAIKAASSDEKPKISNEARRFHKFASQYSWSYSVFLETPSWLLDDLEAILDEAKDDLNIFIDYDEIKFFKNLRRLFGSKEE